ncbi:GNAT family N-acetyltransferase [Demequina aurantiaca]|uniref:GNAT family N-acetyltransferase n=1 Tax=Demequina aurantiaca TaxID=676200 RepID=UPI003D33236C
MTTSNPPAIEIYPYSAADLDLLRRANTPELMDQMGGVEDDAGVLRRHERYLRLPAINQGQQFRVTIPGHPEGVGMVGFWTPDPQVPDELECGWSVEAGFRGRAIAPSAAIALIDWLRERGHTGVLRAFPSVTNGASNAVCQKAGFTLVGTTTDPAVGAGETVLNDWVYPLAAGLD